MITAKCEEKSLVVNIHGEIGQSFFDFPDSEKEENSVASVKDLQEVLSKNKNIPTVNVYINSPGGEISSGFMIYDTFSFIQSDVQTISLGTSASMAALLLLSGTKGKRKILENSNVMLHDLSGGTTGKYGDIMAATQHMQKTHRKIFDIIQKNTNLTDEEIEVNLKNDFWLDSEEVLRYGIVDKIISSSN